MVAGSSARRGESGAVERDAHGFEGICAVGGLGDGHAGEAVDGERAGGQVDGDALGDAFTEDEGLGVGDLGEDDVGRVLLADRLVGALAEALPDFLGEGRARDHGLEEASLEASLGDGLVGATDAGDDAVACFEDVLQRCVGDIGDLAEGVPDPVVEDASVDTGEFVPGVVVEFGPAVCVSFSSDGAGGGRGP